MSTILVVDDKEANLLAIEGLLAAGDRTILNARTGEDALKMLLKEPIDLVILDVQMPTMDGFEVAQILKSNKKTRDIPIIFASAEKTERTAQMQGYREGAVDYLSKPLDPDVVKAKVSVLLQLQAQRKELLEKNAALEEAQEQLKALNKELESFSYSVSHDLRAPLRSINGFAKILSDDYSQVLDDEGKKLLTSVQRNASRMGILIDELLAFSKLGRKPVEKTTVNMNEIISQILSENEAAKNSNLKMAVSDLPEAQADKVLITQVWANLISNALKYSSGKDSPSIEIGATSREGEVEYYVKDNGAGFNMAYAAKLFGVFQRLHRPEEFEGTGVGLAIVYKIVTKHGGRVWAEGKVGEGATFRFTLPV